MVYGLEASSCHPLTVFGNLLMESMLCYRGPFNSNNQYMNSTPKNIQEINMNSWSWYTEVLLRGHRSNGVVGVSIHLLRQGACSLYYTRTHTPPHTHTPTPPRTPPHTPNTPTPSHTHPRTTNKPVLQISKTNPMCTSGSVFFVNQKYRFVILWHTVCMGLYESQSDYGRNINCELSKRNNFYKQHEIYLWQRLQRPWHLTSQWYHVRWQRSQEIQSKMCSYKP